MKPIYLLLVLVLAIPAVSAADNETILSFVGAQPFGENPVQIIDNSSGAIVFIGNTTSRNITLQLYRGYDLRVEDAGLSDAVNNPDSGLIGALDYVRRNPIGCIAGSFMLGILLSAITRKRGK